VASPVSGLSSRVIARRAWPRHHPDMNIDIVRQAAANRACWQVLLAGVIATASMDLLSMVAIRLRLFPASAERERERLHAAVEKFDLERSIGDRPWLPNQLIQPLFCHCATAALIHVHAVR